MISWLVCFLYICFLAAVTNKVHYLDLSCPCAQNSTSTFNPPEFPALPFKASLDSRVSLRLPRALYCFRLQHCTR